MGAPAGVLSRLAGSGGRMAATFAATQSELANMLQPAAFCSMPLASRCTWQASGFSSGAAAGVERGAAASSSSSSGGGSAESASAMPSQHQQQAQQQDVVPHAPGAAAPSGVAAALGAGAASGAGGASTVSPQEAAKFAVLAGEWWDPSGPFAPLHAMNPVRCRFLRSALCSAFGRDALQPRPLASLRLLDVGCGGGLLAESLARMGAHVTGIDVNESGIATARAHAALDPGLAGRLDYRTASAEQLVAAGESFDALVASEVIEHVASLPAFCSALAALTRPGGGVAISTLNRTLRSYLAAVLVAERVLRWVPPNTHDWERFVTPHELAMQMEESTGGGGCNDSPGGSPLRLHLLAGMEYNPLSRAWALGRDTGINYIAWFAKPAVGAAGAGAAE